MPYSFTIDRKQLMTELVAAAPSLRKEAEAIVDRRYFQPAVQNLKDEFEKHPVTTEIRGGIDAKNDSGTLESDFRPAPRGKKQKAARDDYSPPNLFSFIGFDAGSDPTAELAKLLDPKSPGGPRLEYLGTNRDSLVFQFQVSAPDWSAIEKVTPLPWTQESNISWAVRIERGLAGIGYFLNAKRPGVRGAGSASHGGIQVQTQLRSGNRFRPVKYLSTLFNRFLRRASSGKEPSGDFKSDV